MTTGRLVLLNGAPGSGKSTLAGLLCARHALALRLDIDVVRSLLGAWLDEPGPAGIAARALALAMARTHLQTGRDVVVPQFLARPEFIDQLAGLAEEVGARFDEVVLTSSADEAAARFAARSSDPGDDTHRDAAALQARAGAEQIAVLYERLMAMADARPRTVRVPSVPGDVDGTLAALVSALQW